MRLLLVVFKLNEKYAQTEKSSCTGDKGVRIDRWIALVQIDN